MRSTSIWICSPPTCCTSTPILSASARNCGSFKVCAKAQGAHALRRDARRREERPPHLLRREQEFENLAVVGRLGVVDDGRDVGQLRVLLERHLVKDVDLLVLEPVAFAQLEEGPADPAEAFHLASLHRQQDFGGPGITQHDLELRSDELVRCLRKHDLGCISAGPADNGFCGEGVLQRLHLCGVPQGAGRVFDIGGADPVELAGIELGVLVAEERLDRDGAAGDRECGAVARRGVVDVIGRHQSARAGHVLHDQIRTAGKVASHVTGECLGIWA